MSHNPNNNNKKDKQEDEADEGGGGGLMPPDKKTKTDKTTKAIVEADCHFICPITLQYPIHPVVAGNGKIWEKSALEEYINLECHAGETTVKCPTTGEKMPTTFIESPTIKNMIEDFINNDSIKGELAETWTKVNDQINEAKNGNVEAMDEVSINYSKGSDGFPQDNNESFLWAKKAHDAGYIPGTNEIGVKITEGIGTAKNEVRGMVCISMAAQGGVDLAAFNLGGAFAQGLYGLGFDKVEAIKWLKVSLSGECEFQRMTPTDKQDAQKLLYELLGPETD